MNLSNRPNVLAHVVTYNSATTIKTCLDALINQDEFQLGENLRVLVTDNNSADDTLEILNDNYSKQVEIIANQSNTGFTGAHNAGFSLGLSRGADYILVLNPDLKLAPNSLSQLLSALESDPRAGMACPKLLRADEQLLAVTPQRFDACGMYITPSIRHFDRGSEEVERGQYDQHQYVFGASGAAVLCSAQFLTDVAIPAEASETKLDSPLEVFDDSFFAYREDADLSWRGQWFGWKCRYVPTAIGYHQRVVLPERRKELPKTLNHFSVRNRFLLQLNNFSILNNLFGIFAQSARNILVIGAICTVERSSFPALKEVILAFPKCMRIRSFIAKKRRVSASQLAKWFANRPSAQPALDPQPLTSEIRSVQAIIVNYNSGSRLSNCLASLIDAREQLAEKIDLSITVVDNASKDESALNAQKRFQSTNVEFKLSEKNLGFAAGINFCAKGNHPDAVLILNPDIIIDGDSIDTLAKNLGKHTDIGAISPTLKGIDGKVQLGFNARAFPTLGSVLVELFFLHRLLPNNPWTKAYLLREDQFLENYLTLTPTGSAVPFENPSLPLVVEQPAGACLLVRKSCFDEVNGFDERFWPAWFEDVDFCKSLLEKSYLSAVTASCTAIHEGGYSLETLPPGKFFEYWYSNLIRYWRKHGTSTEYATLRTLLPLALILRSISVAALGICKKTDEDASSTRKLSKTLLRLALSGPSGDHR